MDVVTAHWTVGDRRLTAAAGSVVGSHYPANYDVLHLDAARPLAVVADGMGAGPGSAAAGRTAVDVFAGFAGLAAGPRDSGVLRAAVAEVQRAVLAAGEGRPYLTGCTLTAFVANPAPSPAADEAWLVQLGDSRVYRLRDGLLELLTVDHTMAWLGVVHGWYAADSDEAAAARYQLTRYAGSPAAPEPDLLSVGLHPGDLFLLCTDGVSDQLSYRQILETLEAGPDAAAAVRALLDRTLVTGDDNATAAIIRVES